MRQNEFSFTQKVGIAVGLVLFALLLLTLLFYTIDILLLIFSAVLIAIFLRGLAVPMSKFCKIGEGWAVLGVSVLLVLVLIGGIASLAPSVAEQVSLLRVQLPESANYLLNSLSKFSSGQALIKYLPDVETIMAKIDAGQIISGVGGVFSSTVGVVGNFFLVVLLAIYIAAEPKMYINGFKKLFPVDSRDRVAQILDETGTTLQWWLIGKIASMVFIGFLTWVGLSILGVPLALSLGLIAGLLSFIPNFGPILSAIPALLLAFIDSPISAVYVLALYVGVQIIESNLVTPFIERETVELPPALTIIFQLVFGVMLGALGLILATPLLAVLMVLIQMVYIQGILGDNNIEVLDNDPEPEVEPA